jgi:hypothetical protein
MKLTDFVGTPVICALIAAPAFMAYKSLATATVDDLSFAPPSCHYAIKVKSGEMIPTDRATGKRIGTFERHADGSVQLTLGNGFSPKASECIKSAKLEQYIQAIPMYR